MSFLDKLGKDLGAAAEKAKFEADKALKLNRINSELGELNNQVQRAVASIGEKVLELHQAGQLHVPELEVWYSQIDQLQAQITAKKAELETVKAMQFGMAAPAAAPTAATRAEAPATAKFCPNCGTPTESAKFCPSCGQKLG